MRRLRWINFAVFSAAVFFGAVSSSAMPSPALLSDPANIARADALIATARSIMPDSGWQRPFGQEAIASYYLEMGRCDEALSLLPDHEPLQVGNEERLVALARRAGLTDCTIELSRRLARTARERKDGHALALAGAYLRVAGNDAEGVALIEIAEAGVKGPLTRTSLLWWMRLQELSIYRGTSLFDPELDRSARALLAAPPSTDERMVQPAAGGFTGLLFDRGDAGLAMSIATAVCVLGRERTIACGYGAYLDTDLDGLSRKIANGSPAERKAAMYMLSRNGAVDRISPHFPQLLEIYEGDRAIAFRMLAHYSHRLWATDKEGAEKGAREALALKVMRPAKARGLDASSWRLSYRRIAEIFAGAGDSKSVAQILRRVQPGRKDRDAYHASIASGYARFGNESAVQRHLRALSDQRLRRAAWWHIAKVTPGIPTEYRFLAVERALAIPVTGTPGVLTGYSGPPPGVVLCGEIAGGRMIASEGASADTLIEFARLNLRKDVSGSRCAYRRYLLDAAAGTGRDDRAKVIALELLRTTDRPCLSISCDDRRVLQLLVQSNLYAEAESLAIRFEGVERVEALVMIAQGLTGSGWARQDPG